MKDDVIVGHVPANLASIVFHFLAWDGNNGFVEITGNSVNQGAGYSLEIPCIYRFYGQQKFVDRLQTLVGDFRSKGLV